MKVTKLSWIAVLGAVTALAQEEGDEPRHRPPPPPIIAALDVNRDGVIDASEIANAAAALKTLDKNGDGKLTFDEFCPPHHRPPPPPDENE